MGERSYVKLLSAPFPHRALLDAVGPDAGAGRRRLEQGAPTK